MVGYTPHKVAVTRFCKGTSPLAAALRAQHEADNLSHRLVELVRDRLIEGYAAQRLGQHRVGLDDDAILAGDLDDFFGHKPPARRHNDRSSTGAGLVVEGHGDGWLLGFLGLLAHRRLSR